MGNLKDIDNGSFYLTKRLMTHMELIPDHTVTFVEAPTGFGKTTALKDYLKNSSRKCKWLNIISESKDIFWADLCDLISEVDRETAQEIRTYDFPSNEKNIAFIRSAIKRIQFQEETYIIVDNYHMIEDSFSDLLINYILDILPSDIHVIFVTQTINNSLIEELISKRKIYYIGKDCFEFTAEDILIFFAMHNQKITPAEAQQLYEYTEGWISAVNLQMIHYAENGSLENHTSLDALVNSTLWEHLRSDEKFFLLGFSRLHRFNIKEAKMLAPDSMRENDIERLLSEIVFIRFDQSNRYYYIHRVLRDYLNKAFLELSKEEQNEIIIRTGKVFEHRDKLFDAYKQYYEAGAWNLIYESIPEMDKLYPYINQENKAFFLNLITECPKDAASNNYYFPVIMCLVLFMYNEKDRLMDNLLDIVYDIEESTDLSERQKKNLLGTVYFVRGFTEFNNIEVMEKFYKKSLDYGGLPVINLTNKVPFTFGCPSVLHLFHREGENVDTEVEQLCNCLPNYYRLSEGHGKGSDAFMKAEILFNRGDLDGAETLCHKALYMADSREQTCITLGALLLLARKSVFDGDYDDFQESIDALRKKVVFHNAGIDSEYVKMIDMCESFVHITNGDKDKVSDWLKDYESIEARLNIFALSYANIIYGRYLYLNEEYQKFLGISGQFLGIASIFGSALAKIYVYINIALCNKALGNTEKTDKFLRLALDIAVNDSIYMPFVENLMYMESDIDNLSMEAAYREFVKKVKSIYRKYSAGLKTISKNARNKDNYGLTVRELDVAKLAAKRLSNKEIAEQLYIAESTVKSNLKIIFNKLNINSRSELSNFF